MDKAKLDPTDAQGEIDQSLRRALQTPPISNEEIVRRSREGRYK